MTCRLVTSSIVNGSLLAACRPSNSGLHQLKYFKGILYDDRRAYVTKGGKTSDQVERAIRLKKQQQKRVRSMDEMRPEERQEAAWRDDALRTNRIRSDGARFTEEAIKTMVRLKERLESGETTDVQEALNEANEAYEFLRPFNRRNRLLNILYQKIMIRAGKMKSVISHINYMKTNGMYPPMVSYITFLRALSDMRLNMRENTVLIRQGHKAFENGLKLWQESIDFKEGRLDEADDKRLRVSPAGVMNTAMAYRKSAEKEYGKTLERVGVFESLCYSYMRFLISIDDKDAAARLIVRAGDLDVANRRAKIDVPHFPSSISELFLMCLGKKSVGEIEARRAFSEARKHAQRLLDGQLDDDEGDTPEKRDAKPSYATREKKAFVRGLRGGDTLALTDADVEEVLGADFAVKRAGRSDLRWKS